MFLDFRLRNARDAFDRRQRQRVQLIARAHDQRLRDGQRERQANRELHALAQLGRRKQRAAEFLDLVDHHVHADAAAGMLCDGACGAEARLENELHGFFVGQHAARLHQATLLGALAHGVHIDAATIVFEDDDHFRAFSVQADFDRALRRLAARRRALPAFRYRARRSYAACARTAAACAPTPDDRARRSHRRPPARHSSSCRWRPGGPGG